jgi:hypothetical protein
MLMVTTTVACRSVPRLFVHHFPCNFLEYEGIIPGPLWYTRMLHWYTHHHAHSIEHLRSPGDPTPFRSYQPLPGIVSSCTDIYTPYRAWCHLLLAQSHPCTRCSRAVHHAAMHRSFVYLRPPRAVAITTPPHYLSLSPPGPRRSTTSLTFFHQREHAGAPLGQEHRWVEDYSHFSSLSPLRSCLLCIVNLIQPLFLPGAS